MRNSCWILLLLCLCLAASAQGEIYRWTDAQGRMHFTQDLSQVPPQHRAAAEDAARRKTGASRLQRIESPPAARAPYTRSVGRRLPGRRVQIPVERAGTQMRVTAILNGHVRAPFIIDTGASDVLIPQWVADELGIVVDRSTRTQVYQTANGLIEQPVVMLDSVDLGGARADDVPASISPSMPIGLLGLSYFNRFTYHIDPAQGLVTLTPNDLDETGGIRGGRSESEWRSEFRSLRARLALIDARRSRLTPAHTRLLEELDQETERIESQIEDLEIEADRARVPHGWRE